MQFSSGFRKKEQEISNLFSASFSDAEGAEAGTVIGALVEVMMKTTAEQDLFAFSAYDDQALIGCIFFSRFSYDADDRTVFILSPVAVKTERQKQGVGQKLITHGLNVLRENGVSIALTYGDPNYYSKVGFQQITEDFAKAPLKMSQPEGWLGQSLTGVKQKPLLGLPICVPALNKPEIW